MRGPRTLEGAADAALLLYLSLLLLAPRGVAAVGGGDIGDLRAVALVTAQAELTAARTDVARARDALTALEGASEEAGADPLLRRDAIARQAAVVALCEAEVQTFKRLLCGALEAAALPPTGAGGASGSGLRSGSRSTPKRALRRTESDEDDGIDPEDSAARNAKGKRPAARLAELPRTISSPPLGYIDAEGKVHRKHAMFAAELGGDMGLCWQAADEATALLDESTRCTASATHLDPLVVHHLTSAILTPIAELISSLVARGQALNVEHKYGPAVAREFVGDSPLTTPDDQRRLKRAQAAVREAASAACRSAGGGSGAARLRRPRTRGPGGGGRGPASGANAAAIGGRGGGRGGRGGPPTCFGCGLQGHVRKDCPTNP
jgi:hypothetical protein